jgi:hypothetical protein
VVVKGDGGEPLFRIGHLNTAVVLKLPVQHLSAQSLAEIRDAVARILQHARAKPAGSAEAREATQTLRRIGTADNEERQSLRE